MAQQVQALEGALQDVASPAWGPFLEVSQSAEHPFALLGTIALLRVAWADGNVNLRERQAILEWARLHGLTDLSPDFVTLECWLDRGIEDSQLRLFRDCVASYARVETAARYERWRLDVLAGARDVARRNGSFFPVAGTTSVLKELDAVLNPAQYL